MNKNKVKRIIAVILIIFLWAALAAMIIAVAGSLANGIDAEAKEAMSVESESVGADAEPFRMLTTAYYMAHTTASGAPVRYGIAAAKEEWLGLTAIIYSVDTDGSLGVVLGHFEILDTGKGADKFGTGLGAIERGEVIDIYFPTREGCYEWMELTGGRVYAQLVDAKG